MLRVVQTGPADPAADHDLLVWAEGPAWFWGVIAVGPSGRDGPVVAAGGPEPTERAALDAAEAARPGGRP